MMKIDEKKKDYFHCLISNDSEDKSCSKDMFGIIACSTCEKNGDCRVCGRHETSFCEKCKNRRFENDKASTTL